MEIRKFLADRTPRFIAYLIDIIPIILLVSAFFYFFLGFDEVLSRYLSRGNDVQPRIEFISDRNLIRNISFLIWVVYCIVMESSPKQGTLGKLIMGIKVIDQEGNRLSFSQASLRNLGKIVSAAVIFLGFAWILFDKKRQGWHDKFQKTFVVDREFSRTF
ncbi:RDD family protein [Algoriphagus sediminis]|uniref:RDD family protein n=1 Tax=Algoriphagus sediminis TaxID=3057113 RepID=A0ABT7YFF4_9BACT|nr:RDD family protein [Algoriphagus sediminis]MDN3205265.1 RDD family protein [Algoriphagus sediminis]